MIEHVSMISHKNSLEEQSELLINKIYDYKNQYKYLHSFVEKCV